MSTFVFAKVGKSCLFRQFKRMRLLQESMIREIWEEYTDEYIDENNRKPTGNNAKKI